MVLPLFIFKIISKYLTKITSHSCIQVIKISAFDKDCSEFTKNS